MPCARFDVCERCACATGTAWGLLNDRPMAIMAFWAFRHSIYFGLVVLFLLNVEPMASSVASYVMVAFIFFFAHTWKAASWAIRNGGSDKAVVAPAVQKIGHVRNDLEVILNLSGRSSGLGLGAVKGAVQILSVASRAPGAEAMLRVGDAIVSVDGELCGGDVRKVGKMLLKAAPLGTVRMTISRAAQVEQAVHTTHPQLETLSLPPSPPAAERARGAPCVV